LCDTDALIISDWNSIYVDYDKYLDNRYKNRLRFSFAHEIGHFILHKNIYNGFRIKNLTNFYKLIKQISQEQYGYFETQANKFANHLLVPRNKLILEKEKTIEKNKQYGLKEMDIKTLNLYLAIPISKIFGVSEKVIEIALSDIE
jgi:Zn-dependent peptidase ImmA (M78 family)